MLIPLLEPIAGPVVVTDPLTTGVVAVEPLAVDPLVDADVPDADDELDGSDDVDAAIVSDPAPLVAVWAFAAVVMPIEMIAVRILRCIAFSCLESNRDSRAVRLRCKTTPDLSKKKMKFRKCGGWNQPRRISEDFPTINIVGPTLRYQGT